MEYMFYYSAFNSPVLSWDTSKVTHMYDMFGYTPFNQQVNSWDVSSVVDMSEMFVASPFNKPLHRWDVSNVTNFAGMFAECVHFNQPLNTWDMSSAINLLYMFYGATMFNQPLDQWNLENAVYMEGVFYNSVSFKQNLAAWSPYKVQTLAVFLEGVDINNPSSDDNQDNYNALLVSWGTNKLNNFVPWFLNFSGGLSQYTDSVAGSSRQALIDNLGWSITDGGGV